MALSADASRGKGGAQKPGTDGAAADRNDDSRRARHRPGGGGAGTARDIAGVDDAVGDPVFGKARRQRQQRGVAMDEDVVVKVARPRHHVGDLASVAAAGEDVADRAKDQRPCRAARALPRAAAPARSAAMRRPSGNSSVTATSGRNASKCASTASRRAARQASSTGRPSASSKRFERLVRRARGRQLDQPRAAAVEAAHGHAARQQRRRRSRRSRQGRRDRRGAAQMAAAEQVLDVEQDARGHRASSGRFSRSRRGVPSRSSMNRWSA